MKKTIVWLTAVLMLATAAAPFSTSAATAKNADIYKGTPVVDGELDDIWKTASVYTVDKTPVIRDESLDPDIDWNPRNVKGTFRLLWDENNLYVYAEINDPYVKDAMDRFNLFISPTNNKKVYQTSKPGQYDENAPVAYVASDLFIKLERNRISASGPDGKYIPKGCYDKVKDGIKQKRKIKVGTNQGWAVEACIPWAPTVKMKQGMTIGFDCEIDDQDTMENGRGIAVWNQPNEEAWCNPSQAGTAVLKGVGGVKPTTTTGKDTTKAPTKTTNKASSTNKPGPTDKPDSTSGATGNGTAVSTSAGDVQSTAPGESTETQQTTVDQDANANTTAQSTTTPQDKDGNSGPWLWVGIGAAVVVVAGAGTGIYLYFKNKRK